ncbi:YcsE-related riboflavin metabolism phosphatase [Mycoplasmopsis lipofaciens]|uniref:YcsE-related riboflavin metabolism phosphatase n=1 Tax=Mycoplasmopsis lipofaciens TaxID=114884 RepID=UPI000488A42F|nr:HAD family hydrolase [Mycoplasmopsis lipofaciens]
MNKEQLKNNIKIAAFDVDGTLLPYSQPEFSDNVTLMMKKLKNRKVVTVLSTAREFVSIGKLMNKTPDLDYFIGANGMFVYDVINKKVIFEKNVSFKDLVIMYDTFKNYQYCSGFMIMDKNNGYVSKNMDIDTWFLKPHKAKLKKLDYKSVDKDHLHIITIACEDDEATRMCMQLAKEVIEQNNLNLEINSQWHKGFFITPKGVHKFSTLDWLCNYLGFSSQKHLIAFGDSSNDLEMIRDSAYGVCMEDGSEEVKSVAKDIALTCKKDGAYLKLQELEII